MRHRTSELVPLCQRAVFLAPAFLSCYVLCPPGVYATDVPHVQLPDILSRNIPCRPQVYDAAVPFGGYKDSGLGREKGEYALKNYSQVSECQLRPG